MADFPKRYCTVEVIFQDGAIQTYTVGFSAGIAPHLARTAGETGVLTLLCGPKAHFFPLSSIREWNITELPAKPEGEKQ